MVLVHNGNMALAQESAPSVRLRALVSLLATAALLAAACAGDDQDFDAVSFGIETDGAAVAGDSEPVGSEAAADDSDEMVEEMDFEEGEAPVEGSASTGQEASQRQIVYRAGVVVEVDDVAASTEAATDLVAARGGIVFGQDTTTEPEPQTTITFKVNPDDFSEILDELGQLGALREQSVSADDVTERVVDLESRIATAEISVERLRQLLSEAGAIDTITNLEQQLLERETTLEVLKGELRTIRQQVAQATITLTLRSIRPTGPTVEVRQTAYEGAGDDGERCPGREDLKIDTGDAVTMCVTIRNLGDVAVGEVEIRDNALDLEPEDFTLLEGDGDRIEPDEEVSFWASLPIDDSVRTELDVSVLALETPDELAFVTSANASDSMVIEADGVDVPGFGTGVSRSWDLLVTLAKGLVFLAGAVLPFIWVIPLVWALRRWWRTRRAARLTGHAAAMPPPPNGRPTDTESTDR